MKKGQLAYGNVDKTDTIQDASKDKTEPTSSLLNEEANPSNNESVGTLLQSCEEHRNYFQRMFEALIKLTAQVGQQSEDNVNCIKKTFRLYYGTPARRNSTFLQNRISRHSEPTQGRAAHKSFWGITQMENASCTAIEGSRKTAVRTASSNDNWEKDEL